MGRRHGDGRDGDGHGRAAARAGQRGDGPRWGRIVAALDRPRGARRSPRGSLVSLFQPFKGDGEGARVRVEIPRGASVGEIATILEDNGVISSAFFFQLRARIAGRTRRPQAGLATSCART